jgi:hypothetical protein
MGTTGVYIILSKRPSHCYNKHAKDIRKYMGKEFRK